MDPVLMCYLNSFKLSKIPNLKLVGEGAATPEIEVGA